MWNPVMIIGAIENHWTTRDLSASRGRNRRRCHLSFSRKAEKQQQRASREKQSKVRSDFFFTKSRTEQAAK
jgi:hypothetical protein